MSDDPESLAERAYRAAEEGAELMWRNVFADTVVALLNRDETVTRDSIRAELVARIASDATSRLDKAAMQGALKGLDGRMPPL